MPPTLTISNLPLSNNRTSSGFSNRFKMTSSMAHLRLQWFSLQAVYQPSPDGSKLDWISIACTAGWSSKISAAFLIGRDVFVVNFVQDSCQPDTAQLQLSCNHRHVIGEVLFVKDDDVHRLTLRFFF